MFRPSYILPGVAAVMLLASTAANAAGYEWKRVDYQYLQSVSEKDRGMLRIYKDYEEREPCQNYRELPPEVKYVDCKLYHRVAIPDPPPPPAPPPAPEPPKVVSSYEIFFPLDSTALDLQANAMVDKAASDIALYQPSAVIVAGYTDTSGAADYNDQLSANRAMAVSAALTQRGIPNTAMNLEAHGQNDLKVPTEDEVHEPQNRRTVIHFMK
ncbi:OmpA family protein [Micavibrio aeruginosavorus]|uniref:Peptidoglycan-associated protein n=1 Tax=Micavibrio aeruginosavorus EPB TaxID=349215 RepID=M4VJ28_9BACT|nr:OmpA family protein [Micavibrio aeruginosavorus]AGH98470.1 peptidoglycan-associated protein [Micavibrio aeruginosavorus EPB]